MPEYPNLTRDRSILSNSCLAPRCSLYFVSCLIVDASRPVSFHIFLACVQLQLSLTWVCPHMVEFADFLGSAEFWCASFNSNEVGHPSFLPSPFLYSPYYTLQNFSPSFLSIFLQFGLINVCYYPAPSIFHLLSSLSSLTSVADIFYLLFFHF